MNKGRIGSDKGDRVASLRKKKQGHAGGREETRAARASGGPPAFGAEAQSDRFEPALEEKWAEAWRRARAAELR